MRRISLLVRGLAGAVGVDGDGVLGSLHWHLECLEDRIGDILGVELLHLGLVAGVRSLQQLFSELRLLLKESRLVAPVAIERLELGLLLEDRLHVTLLHSSLQAQDLGSVAGQARHGLALGIGVGCLHPCGGHGHTCGLQNLPPVWAWRCKARGPALEQRQDGEECQGHGQRGGACHALGAMRKWVRGFPSPNL